MKEIPIRKEKSNNTKTVPEPLVFLYINNEQNARNGSNHSSLKP